MLTLLVAIGLALLAGAVSAAIVIVGALLVMGQAILRAMIAGL